MNRPIRYRTTLDGQTWASMGSARGKLGQIWVPISREPENDEERAAMPAMLLRALEGEARPDGTRTMPLVADVRFPDEMDAAHKQGRAR